jgi:DNA mismatch repair protein MutS2
MDVFALRVRPVDVGGGGGRGVRAVTTPVNLLIPGRREGGYGARIISSPNGGGKTLALKSFGLAAIVAKLSIPISTTETESAGGDERYLVVDYFDEILVEVGDSKSVRRQESMLVARLNLFSALI